MGCFNSLRCVVSDKLQPSCAVPILCRGLYSAGLFMGSHERAPKNDMLAFCSISVERSLFETVVRVQQFLR